ncbi:hypothetical protein VTO73DRAFT_7597 [Trametes versicolor]
MTTDLRWQTNEALLQRQRVLLKVQADTQRELLEVNRLLKSRFAPVNMLPVEILAEILLVVQARIFARPEVNGMARRWITATSVCSHWRKLVNSTPSFWRSIAVQRAPELLSLSLERSIPGLPLSISFENASFPWPSFRPILQDRAKDVRALRFARIDYAFLGQFAGSIFDSPTPALEELYIHYKHDGEDDDFDDHGYYIEPVLPTVHDNLPALRSLSLRGLEPAADNTFFTRLRRLMMCDTTNFSLAALLDVLAACTHLEELDLARSLKDWLEWDRDRLPRRADDGSSRPVVLLPRVRTLRLAGYYYKEGAILLSYLRFPNATDIKMVSLSGWSDEETLDIANMLPGNPQDTFPALNTITSVEVIVMDEVYEMRMRGLQGATIFLSLDGEGMCIGQELGAACAVLALPGLCRGASITSLHFTGKFTDATEFTDPDKLGQLVASVDPEAQRWVTLFKEFGSLGTLHITEAGLCRSMWVGLWAASDLFGKQCCGSLCSVILDGFTSFEGSYSYDGLAKDFESMWKTLNFRAQSGLRLHALTLDVSISNRSAGMDDQRDSYLHKFEDLVADLRFFPAHLFGDDWRDDDDYYYRGTVW